MDVTIRLTERQQLLLLANEMNDHPEWSAIARKINRARDRAETTADTGQQMAERTDDICETAQERQELGLPDLADEDNGKARRYNNHRTDQGGWCRWSLTSAATSASVGDHCPVGCAASAVEADQ